jgi:hypothetical protein
MLIKPIVSFLKPNRTFTKRLEMPLICYALLQQLKNPINEKTFIINAA